MDFDGDARLNYIVCGWYTPDYADYARGLIDSLDVLCEPHDIVAVDPGEGGWEAQTMRKPRQIMQAMRRHPDKTIIFLDVDCRVVESVSPLSKVSGDIAVHLMAGARSRGYGRLFGRTTTLVLNPTGATRAFVATWCALSEDAPRGQVDQHTFTEAIVRTPGLSVVNLTAEWCAMEKDEIEHPAIVHAGAARKARKVSGLLRWVYGVQHAIGRRYDHPRTA